MASTPEDAFSKSYYINGLKAHSSTIVEIPVFLKNINDFKNFSGPLETTVTFNEFTTSIKPKHAVIVFNKM